MANPASKRRKLSPAATEELESKTADEDMSDESSQDSRVVLERATRSNACSQRVRTIPIIPSGSVCSTDLFQLQIDELLSKVRPDYERRMIKAENALRKLKTIIERIPNRGAKTVCLNLLSYWNFAPNTLSPYRLYKPRRTTINLTVFGYLFPVHGPVEKRNIL